ncbi:Translation protein, beta-barrel domain,Translation initiation factor IF- 2, domain 3,P- [Cinara cedri]|uniref:Eukaryotic translation initiation factor 5B n=1 Tax=Cinara cedri TaxID=506608 RepID=A0A5E4NM46_9HEMI|nr:Translation protein, beta-barrel domain,Translation initiation factor IF- 2, domain 3,P- [Cinara cedri]
MSTNDAKKKKKPTAPAKTKKGPGKNAIAALKEVLQQQKEEEEKLRREEEEEEKRLEELERQKEEKERLEQEKKEQKRLKEREKREKLKAEGKLLTPKQKADRARAQLLLDTFKAQSEALQAQRNIELSEKSNETNESTENNADIIKKVENIKIENGEQTNVEEESNLRAAVVCVLGHVDTGKTKILDKLRRTNVQDGEAGGITQQIGATNVPLHAIKEQTKVVNGYTSRKFLVPGLLIIDTPGHESFSNLRNRGSSLCDIAILVVDIMHGLEPQTIESINILKTKKTPFIVALNKIDRLYDWQTNPRKDVRDILTSQHINTQNEFKTRSQSVILQFAEQGLNAALFYENPDPKSYVSLVPTSAITGEGMGNLLDLIVENCQTHLYKRLIFNSELQATVLEVKAITGLGTTIDTILVNGYLREGDTIVVAGTDGPVVTQIRSLLMPQPLKELRVKNAYVEYKEIKAAQGVKIAAKDLEKAIAGLNIYVAHKAEEIDNLKDVVARELKSALSTIKLQDRGVYVQASTLGSLEALLDFLRTSNIPYSNIRIGPVVKKDVMKASIMLEHSPIYATILAFDVKIEKDAQELADTLNVKIFQADIIYHLFDKFTAYQDDLKKKNRDQYKSVAVFPCKLKILPQFIFNSRDPIVMGVIVEAGIVKEGTPICVPTKEFVDLGIVTSIESNHKAVESARKGQEICIKIEPLPSEAPKMYGRHFDEKDILVSKITRQSIDVCKDYFRDDLLKTDWQLMVELKKLFEIL